MDDEGDRRGAPRRRASVFGDVHIDEIRGFGHTLEQAQLYMDPQGIDVTRILPRRELHPAPALNSTVPRPLGMQLGPDIVNPLNIPRGGPASVDSGGSVSLFHLEDSQNPFSIEPTKGQRVDQWWPTTHVQRLFTLAKVVDGIARGYYWVGTLYKYKQNLDDLLNDDQVMETSPRAEDYKYLRDPDIILGILTQLETVIRAWKQEHPNRSYMDVPWTKLGVDLNGCISFHLYPNKKGSGNEITRQTTWTRALSQHAKLPGHKKCHRVVIFLITLNPKQDVIIPRKWLNRSFFEDSSS
jgi:hypothetical protein